jgi:hypothetical protein
MRATRGAMSTGMISSPKAVAAKSPILRSSVFAM